MGAGHTFVGRGTPCGCWRRRGRHGDCRCRGGAGGDSDEIPMTFRSPTTLTGDGGGVGRRCGAGGEQSRRWLRLTTRSARVWSVGGVSGTINLRYPCRRPPPPFIWRRATGAHQPSGLGAPDQGVFVRARPDSDPLGSGSAGDQTNTVAVGMSAGHVSSGQAMPSTSAAPPSYTQGSFVGGNCHHEDRVPAEPPVVQVHSLHITQADEGVAPNLPLNTTSIPPPPSSPQEIDQAIYDQGRELHELLHLFKQATTEPLAALSSKLRSTRPSLRHIPLQCLLLRQLPTGAVQDLKEKLVRESLSSRWRRTLWQKKMWHTE
jgi:hypothetical protein